MKTILHTYSSGIIKRCGPKTSILVVHTAFWECHCTFSMTASGGGNQTNLLILSEEIPGKVQWYTVTQSLLSASLSFSFFFFLGGGGGIFLELSSNKNCIEVQKEEEKFCVVCSLPP